MVVAVHNFEGCGKEGPLRAIFFSEFHHLQGPMIHCQASSSSSNCDVVTKSVFDAVSHYVIPKRQLVRRTITINVKGYKIIGYPVVIEDNQYKRNQFMFNVCFVCYSWSRTVHFEPALKKLAEYLVNLELENGFLSQETAVGDVNGHGSDPGPSGARLLQILETTLADLNQKSFSTINVGNNQLQLAVIRKKPDPPPVYDHHVPVLMVADVIGLERWDLTTVQILPYIDGVNYVSRIAQLADVDSSLVKACVQNLCFYGVVKIMSIFQYSNTYCVTSKVLRLRTDRNLRQELLQAIRLDDHEIKFRHLYELICAFASGKTVRELCLQFNVRRDIKLCLDERALVQFLVLHGILRRIHLYPVALEHQQGTEGASAATAAAASTAATAANATATTASQYPYVTSLFNGARPYDEVCCKLRVATSQLNEIIENDTNVIVIRK